MAHAHLSHDRPRFVRLGALAIRIGERRTIGVVRAQLRASEAWLIGLAILIGAAGGGLAIAQSGIARALQRLLYGLPVEQRLSSVGHLAPAQLLVLPAGGLVLGLFTLVLRPKRRTLIDAVEANALHGGQMSMRDSLFVSAQTMLSNGFGVSVGLEAAYAQLGGGVASVVGQFLTLRRSDLRTLVGAGAGAAIAAAFGAPLAGAFYAFEVVIGSYTPAAIAPVTAAALAGTLIARASGAQPYVFDIASSETVTAADYVLYAALGAVCAFVAIGLMQAQATCERWSKRAPIPGWARPALGGLLLVPIVFFSPQAMSAGHGALTLDLATSTPLKLLIMVFVLKALASIVSLGFGFRGGLFFASLFLGSLLGHISADLLALVSPHWTMAPQDAALVGMAALGVAVVGGPFTMAMLVLEATHDFALTGAALAAALVASTIVRDRFGYSFSTWRLHLRGETVRSARDVGWVRALTVGTMMRKGPPTAPAATSIAEFRGKFALGSTSRVVLTDAVGHYAGIVLPTTAYREEANTQASVGGLAIQSKAVLTPEDDITQAMQTFDASGADELAVVDADGSVLGTLSEVYVRRRYATELERSQRELFGEV